MSKNKKDSLSIFISLVLRHKPEAAGIQLSEYGWASVSDLLSGMNAIGKIIDFDTLKQIVVEDEKNRYSFNENKTLIRANQGHSVLVDLGLKEIIPPDTLYHGTATRSLDQINHDGLKPMSRQYVHLSNDYETALSVGVRHGIAVVLVINTKEMQKDGYSFYISQNGVWLTKTVPAKYLSLYQL